MAYTLSHMLDSTKKSYKLKMVAGENGLESIISWVHLIEDISTTDFLRGNELIITTGLRYEGEEWLQGFIEELLNRNVKGMIVNTGRYIYEIPKEIISYCDRVNFPLFTMPWEVHLEDIMQNLINQIFQAERVEQNVEQMLRKALLRPEKIDEYLPYLLELGYAEMGTYHMMLLRTSIGEKSDTKDRMMKQMKIQISNLLSPYQIFFDITFYQMDLILVVRECEERLFEELAKRIMYRMKDLFPGLSFEMAIGPTTNRITELYRSYQRGKVAVKPNYLDERGICIYRELGVEKLLFEIQDRTLLENIVQESLGKILAYDSKHRSDYTEVLRLFIFLDGSIQAVAEKMFTHRNTINYRMNKIREILGKNLSDPRDRINCQMAFYIYDYLEM